MDTRTKHTVAQDRLIVAEQRIVEAERRKSVCNLQQLAFEQKQFEKRMTSFFNSWNSTLSDRPAKMRGRSTSEVSFRNIPRSNSLSETLPIHLSKFSVSLHESKQNVLFLPKIDDSERRFSLYSDGDTSENHLSTSDMESSEEGEYPKSKSQIINPKRITIKRKTLPKLVSKQNKSLPPILAVTPPEEDALFLTQQYFL